MKLPRGIWYEKSADRYRVRLYRNGIAYLKGYFPTLPEAEAALADLQDYLDTNVPFNPKDFVKPTPRPSFNQLSKSLQEDVAPRLKK